MFSLVLSIVIQKSEELTFTSGKPLFGRGGRHLRDHDSRGWMLDKEIRPEMSSRDAVTFAQDIK